MRLFFLIISFLFGTSSFVNAQIPHRINGSPYPVSQTPDTLFVVNLWEYSDSEKLTIQTLQGLLAKTNPTLFSWIGGSSTIWLDDLENNYSFVSDTSYWNDFPGLMSHFANEISGYILCNLHDNSSNTAISLCGILNAIAVTPSESALMTSLGIPLLQDVTSLDESWLFENYESQLSKEIVVYQKEEKDLFLGDYSVFSNAFHFYDPINSSLTTDALARMNDNSVLLGWGDSEYYLVETASNHSLQVHPADWARNLSVYSNFEATTIQNTHADSVISGEDVHTVCFVMSDGDNVQWLLNDFSTNPNWYGSPNRGQVDIGWTMSPAMCELAPAVLKHFYDNAANNPNGQDYFIAGPSGLGYNFPNLSPSITSATALLNEYMGKADLNIVNILGTSNDEAYMAPYLLQPNIDALFYYDYFNYSALNGSITFVNNKPIIGSRYNFWDGFESVASLAQNINALPKDAYSSDGYSLIATHVWTKSVDSIIACAALLDSNVIVVTPDEFIKRIQSKMGSTVEVNENIDSDLRIYPNPTTNELLILSEQLEITEINIINSTGEAIRSYQKNPGILNVVDLPHGVYFIQFVSDDQRITRKFIKSKN